MEHEEKKKPIKVYARVRPLNEEEVDRNEKTSVETFLEDEKKIKIRDEKHSQETTYYFDGVFSGEDSNEKVFFHTTKHLVTKFLNGMNCAVLTYGQTGSGKTFTLMADGCITDYAITELFDKINADKIHKYKITCSFVQVYLEKVYDLLGVDNKEELPVREHPKRGIYVSNLSHHQANSAEEVFTLLEKGKEELVTAETKMVRQSSRSHSIFQLSIERRLDVTKKKLILANTEHGAPTELPHLCVPDDVMVLEEDMVLRGKMDICDLAGSERLGKTMVEGINRSEARYINSSLLELGNVIYALSEGRRRHIPFRNSTLTRLLQECLGSRCITSFIVCVAPSASEAYETRCSLNFGTRARTITNKERMSVNVEVDYQLLAKKLRRKIELLENELNESRPIRDFISSSLQNLNNTVETQTELVNMEEQLCRVHQPGPSLDTLKHCLGISEMLEVLLENNENLCQQHKNSDTLRSSAMMEMFTMATKRISSIHNNLAWEEFKGNMEKHDVNNFIDSCLQKMENVRNEMLVISDGHDKNDLFVEAAYTISEACSDIENMLGNILKSNTSILESLDRRSGDTDVNSLYEVMHQLMDMFSRHDTIPDKQNCMNYIYYLMNLLQVLQIARLLLESSRITPNECISAASSKPFIWSTSVEEGTSSDIEGNSHEDSYFGDISSISKIDHDRPEIEQITNDLNSERINPPLQVKLNRSQSFKVKSDMIWNGNIEDTSTIPLPSEDGSIDPSLAKLPKRKSKVHSMDYPRTQTKRYVFIDDGSTKSLTSDQNEVETYQMKAELIDLEKRYDELSKKFKTTVGEKDVLKDKLKILQQDKMILMTERDYAQQQFEALLNKQMDVNKLNEDNETKRISSRTSIMQEENNDETIAMLKNMLKEKEEDMKRLETENKNLLKNMDDRKHLRFLQSFVEEKDEDNNQNEHDAKYNKEVVAFANDILTLSNAVDVVNYQESVRRSISNIDDINQLESELFYMIENNVKYEAALTDIRFRVNRMLTGEPIASNEDDNLKVSKKTVAPKVVTTRSPMHVTKKMTDMKRNQRKRIEQVRKMYGEQPVTAAKEIKACRASRVKELLQEKLRMNDHIDKLEKDLTTKDMELRESKKKIELLVMELGHLDIELNRQSSTLTLSRQATTLSASSIKGDKSQKCVDVCLPFCENEDVEIIEIPEIQYSDMMNIVNTCLTPVDGSKTLQAVKEEEMVPVEELESMKLEAETYRRRYKDIESLYTNLKENGEQNNLLKENISLQRKATYLEDSNRALNSEIKTIKSTNHDRKLKVQELRERNNSLIQELEHYKRQSVQTQAKSDAAKLKLEKKLSKAKERYSTLENCSQKMEDEIQVLRKHAANKSFNDSGLAQSEDSEYLIGI